MCDYYAYKKYTRNSRKSQGNLVKLMVDTAFNGLHCGGQAGEEFSGILRSDDATADVNINRFFDGSGETTNRDGEPMRVNFFTGRNISGTNIPEGNEGFQNMKEQMYRYFGVVLGCSEYPDPADWYSGRNLKEVHKFMDFHKEMYFFILQIISGAMKVGFSKDDITLFLAFLVDIYIPVANPETNEVAYFNHPLIANTREPPFFNPEEYISKLPFLTDKLLPYNLDIGANPIAPNNLPVVPAVTAAPEKRSEFHPHHHHIHNYNKRQDFSSAPPPLTVPPEPTSTTAMNVTTTDTPQSVPNSIIPIAVGVGVGVGLAVIFISAAIAYLVIRKRRVSKRQSLPLALGKGHLDNIEMSGPPPPATKPREEVRKPERVDRTEGQNAVGKPKAKGHLRQVSFSEP